MAGQNEESRSINVESFWQISGAKERAIDDVQSKDSPTPIS